VKLTISTTPSFASRWLIPRLPDLTRLHPDLDLHILATERLSSFQTDSVDLAVRYGRPPFGPGLATELLFEQETVAVCSPSLLKEYGHPRTSQELQRYTLLHDAHNFWPEFVEKNLGKPETEFKGISFSQTSHAIEAAIAGQGIVLANRDFVSRDIMAGRLAQAIDGVLHGKASFYLVWPRYRKKASLEQLVQWMLGEAAH
jgi:LysR family glycine cleavage system transcriptional activator